MADDPMKELLDNFETTDEYAARRTKEAKKYKVAKPGDPGVQVLKLEGDEPKKPTTAAQRSAMVNALKEN